MLFVLVFTDSTFLLWFFLFSLIIDLYFLVAAVISQIFNPIAKLLIPIGIPSNQVKR